MTNVSETVVSRKLQLAVNGGTTSAGSVKTILKSFTNIRTDATGDRLMVAATALAGLMKDTVNNVYHTDRSQLENVDNA